MEEMRYDLWNAVREGSYGEVLSLLERGANANSRFAGQSVLFVASANGRLDIVELLLLYGADVDEGGFREPPLMRAIINKHKNIVAYLLKKSANPNIQSAYGNSCLHIVNDVEIARLLLDSNYDLTLINQNKLTAKEYARALGRTEISNLIEQYEWVPIKEPEE